MRSHTKIPKSFFYRVDFVPLLLFFVVVVVAFGLTSTPHEIEIRVHCSSPIRAIRAVTFANRWYSVHHYPQSQSHRKVTSEKLRLFILFSQKAAPFSVVRRPWVVHCCANATERTNDRQSQAKTMWLTDNRWEITHNSFFDLLRIYLARFGKRQPATTTMKWKMYANFLSSRAFAWHQRNDNVKYTIPWANKFAGALIIWWTVK